MTLIKSLNSILFFFGFNVSKDRTARLLLLSCGFCILLLTIRITVTGSSFYLFLVWNLFLAFIPFFVTSFLRRIDRPINKKVFWLFFIVWLLFVPNSFYIITDLFHLDEGFKAPQWFDLVLLFSFAWNGLLIGIISLRQMEQLISSYLQPQWKNIFLYSILFLSAIGIYIGRYLRYNSWDIISNPLQLTKDILYLCIHPLRNFNDWGMIVCFTLLMVFIYHSFKSISHDLP